MLDVADTSIHRKEVDHMRFRWLKKASEQAVVTMSLARYTCTKLTIEEAVRATLANGRHCINHESIGKATFDRLCKMVKQLTVVQRAKAK